MAFGMISFLFFLAQISIWDRFSCAATDLWRRISRQTLLIERQNACVDVGRCYCPVHLLTHQTKPQDVFVCCSSLCSIADGMFVVFFMVLGKSLNAIFDIWRKKCYDFSQGQAVEAARLALNSVG